MMQEKENKVIITGENFSIIFDKTFGHFSSYKLGETEYIVNGLLPNFRRAPTDNDIGNDMAKRCQSWITASEHRSIQSFGAEKTGPSEVRIRAFYILQEVSSKEVVTYRILGTGDILVNVHFYGGKSDMEPMPRLGLNVRINPGFTDLEWYGRGPWENYWDRNSAAFVGNYKSTVDEQFYPYVRPQETGYKTDVRWFVLTGENKKGLFIQGDPVVCFSALSYSYDDLKGFKHGGKHPSDLEKENFIDLNIDYRQMGVGGDDSWGARTHEEYTLPSKEYVYSFRFRPFLLAKDNPEKLASERFEFPEK